MVKRVMHLSKFGVSMEIPTLFTDFLQELELFLLN